MPLKYRVGDLIRVVDMNTTGLCIPAWKSNVKHKNQAREFALSSKGTDFEDYFVPLEQKIGLIVKIHKNRLDQPLVYEVQFGQNIWFFKFVFAQKYFEPVEDQSNDKGRRLRTI